MDQALILRSAYLLDENGRARRDAEVIVQGARIAEVRESSPQQESDRAKLIDLGRAVLIPGLVNAHTHLELGLARADTRPQRRFTDWIREVIKTTRACAPEEFNNAVRSGLEQSGKAGVTSLGDICGRVSDWEAYARSGVTIRVFHEIIDFNPETANLSFESLKRRVNEHADAQGSLVGVSPHTPYTVSEDLLRRCIEFAHENDLPLSIHLAETLAEAQFLQQGTGEISEFRREFGLPRGWRPPRASPVRYLERLGFFRKPALLVHCNYVGDDDLELIERSGSSVVFCPRSHSYFGHEKHPFPKMLERGINVALGTDSLLSSPSLGILEEMRFVREEYPGVEPEALLKMATANGLKALGLSPKGGLLERGAPADLVGIEVPEEESRGPLEAVLSERAEVVFCMSKGEVIIA
jgi:cytosine/adenosine deaminase-related metal-dependent hydrolase